METPTLYQHMVTIIDERDKRYEQRFQAQEEATKRALASLEKRFEGVNEFRAALSDQTQSFVPRSELDTRFLAIEKDIANLAQSTSEHRGRGEGYGAGFLYLVAGLGVALAALSIVITLVTR